MKRYTLSQFDVVSRVLGEKGLDTRSALHTDFWIRIGPLPFHFDVIARLVHNLCFVTLCWSMSNALTSCLFCKIIKGSIPCHKVYETERTLAFLDINPLSRGHILVIPKYHAGKLHQVPDMHLHDLLPVTKKIVKSLGVENYNVLQNNGRLAHQEVDHVHFHIIPKTEQEGLGIHWPQLKFTNDELAQFARDIRSKIDE